MASGTLALLTLLISNSLVSDGDGSVGPSGLVVRRGPRLLLLRFAAALGMQMMFEYSNVRFN